jgi:hypothetical protein
MFTCNLPPSTFDHRMNYPGTWDKERVKFHDGWELEPVSELHPDTLSESGKGPVQARALTSRGNNFLFYKGHWGEEDMWLHMPPGTAVVGMGLAFKHCWHMMTREAGTASARGVATWRGKVPLQLSASGPV